MLEEPNILREIIGNVEDLDARLIYADWLDERGDPRGEFIRVQCELASLPHPILDAEREHAERLTQRSNALLREHFETWASKLLDRGLRHSQIEFRCGDIDGVSLNPENFKVVQDLETIAPLVRRFRFTSAEETVGSIQRWRPLERAVQITFQFYEEIPQQMKPLIETLQTLGKLRALCFNGNQLGNGLLRALGDSQGFTSLCALDLEAIGMDDEGIAPLVSNPELVGRLVWLNLAFNRITSVGTRTLVNSQAIDQLQNLRLRGNEILDTDIPSLRRRFGKACDLVRLYDRFNRNSD
ncbi:MAG: TIGR02996 domain-containing protein [Rubripirellula sp.]